MAQEVIVETRRLTKIYRDFWGRQKKTALRALNVDRGHRQADRLAATSRGHHLTRRGGFAAIA